MKRWGSIWLMFSLVTLPLIKPLKNLLKKLVTVSNILDTKFQHGGDPWHWIWHQHQLLGSGFTWHLKLNLCPTVVSHLHLESVLWPCYLPPSGEMPGLRSHDNSRCTCFLVLTTHVIKYTITKQHHFMTWPRWDTFRDALVCTYVLHGCYGERCSREGRKEAGRGFCFVGLSKVHHFSAFTKASSLSRQTFALMFAMKCRQRQTAVWL